MSTGKTIANLAVKLGADTKEFESGMKKGKTELQEFAAGAKKMAGIAIAAFAAASGAALKMANDAAEYADQFDKASISTGLSRDTLQSLSYVADQAGIQFSTLSSSVGKLFRTMGDAAYGNKRQKESFEKLGISIYDVNGGLKSMETIFPQVISALNSMDNETERNAIGMDLFGRSANELIPRLAELGDNGIQKLTDKAQALHLVMSDKGISTLVEYKDGMSTLKQQMSALMREAILPFAEAMNESIIPQMSSIISKIAAWQERKFADSLVKERDELNAMVTAITNVNTGEGDRIRLLDELNRKFPSFIGYIDSEKVSNEQLIGRLAKVNELYAAKILLVNREAALSHKSGERSRLAFREADLVAKIEKDKALLAKYHELEKGLGGASFTDRIQDKHIENRIAVVSLALEKVRKKREDINQEILETLNLLDGESAKITEIANLLDFQGKNNSWSNATPIPGSSSSGTSNLSLTSNVSGVSIPNQVDPMFGFEQDIIQLDKLKEKIEEVKPVIMDFSSTLQSAFADMAVSFGESLGHMISGASGYDGLFANIQNSFGEFAQKIGAMLIAYGGAAIAFEAALEYPPAAIAAGVALVAIGTALTDSMSNPNVSSGGGVSTAGAGTYSSASGGHSTQTLELVWRRAGQDLVAMVDSERRANASIFNR